MTNLRFRFEAGRCPLLDLLVLALLSASVACGREASRQSLLVFAAASLTEPFEALAEEFEAQHPSVDVRLNCAGTPQLVLQIRAGAPVDVFAAADSVELERVAEFGRLRGDAAVFAHNRLAIVTARGNPKGVSGLDDLAREDLVVVLAGPAVPAGRYARRALASAGVAVRSASDEPSVKAVVNKVRMNEADAGIVYVTDALSAGDAIATVAIAAEHQVLATYPLAVLTGGREPELGAAFVAWVRSTEGRAILKRFGFETP